MCLSSINTGTCREGYMKIMQALTLHSEVKKKYNEEQGAKPTQIMGRPNTITLWGGLSGVPSLRFPSGNVLFWYGEAT